MESLLQIGVGDDRSQQQPGSVTGGENHPLTLAVKGEPDDGYDPTLGWGRYGNPLFQSPSDFHLQSGSPCIDTGDPDFEAMPWPGDRVDLDLDGRDRVVNGRVDVGAYEWYSGPLPDAGIQPDASPATLPYARQWIDDGDVAAVVEALRSSRITQGPITPEFERRVAEARSLGFERCLVAPSNLKGWKRPAGMEVVGSIEDLAPGEHIIALKISDDVERLTHVEHDLEEGAKVGIVSYGISSRSAAGACTCRFSARGPRSTSATRRASAASTSRRACSSSAARRASYSSSHST